jgi:nucleoside-diphosphate-sugar epimerase
LETTEEETILVTGAGGFIGSTLVATLITSGKKVRALVGAPGHRARELPTYVPIARAEITDLASICQLTAGADVVVHIAGLPSVGASFASAGEYARVHVGGTATVLEACRRTFVRRLVYVSSAEVYGCPQTNPVSEDHPPQARSPYAAAKIGAERFVESFVYAFGIEAVVLRPFSIYGPGLSPLSLIGTIIRQARLNKSIVLDDLKPVRDYCYVSDLTEAIARACTVRTSGLATLNVGTGLGTSVAELAALILEILGRDIPVREDARKQRPGTSQIHCLIADCQLAGDVLRWFPKWTLRSGLEQTVHALEQEWQRDS